MHIAKLNTGQLVQVLKFGSTVLFNDRTDNVLIYTPIGARPRKRDLRWIFATEVVWHHIFTFTFKE